MNNHKIKREPPAYFRWTILAVISLIMFGNYYVYDSIAPIADLLSSQLGFSDAQIGSLRTLYSVPNIVMVLIGGILIDRIGIKKSALIFTTLCMTGILITFSKGEYIYMAVGWFIFGLGAESLIVAVTTSVAKWFKGKELSFAFGLNLTIARLGSYAAEISPGWAKSLYTTWKGPLVLAVIAGAISMVCVIIYYAMDTYASKNYELKKEQKQDKIDLKEIFRFKPSFWYVVLLCVTFYSAIFPFQTFAVKFFQDFHHVTRETGGYLNGLPILFAMILTPLFGLLADKIGKRATLMMIGSVMIIPIYLTMVYTNITLYIPMAILGISFSLVPAIMWPSVAILVDDKKHGTAYGLMTMIQNIGLAGFNYLIGTVNDVTGNYVAGMWIFSTLGFFGLFFAYMLKRSEKGPNGQGLELPTI